MPNIKPERWTTALRRVAEIERRSAVLPKRRFRRKFTYSKRSAWATPAGLDALPLDQRPELAGIGSIRGRSRADALLIGKFDVDTEVRLRSFYSDNGLCVRYQTGGQRNGVTRTVKAHGMVHPHAPGLMPHVFEHGTILNGQGAYLVETIVEGQPATRAQLQGLITPLTAQLHRVHNGVGITGKSLTNVVGTGYSWRWKKFRQAVKVNPHVDRAVRGLIDRDARLEVSLAHGDLVGSNILVAEDSFYLVDWEFADLKPIAFDMAKILINVDDIEATIPQIQAGLGNEIGQQSGYYTFREQVALAIVLTLSWYPNHATKAKVARRMDALKRQTTKRLNAIEQLLEAA